MKYIHTYILLTLSIGVNLPSQMFAAHTKQDLASKTTATSNVADLIAAIESNDVSQVQALIAAGVSPSIMRNTSITALDIVLGFNDNENLKQKAIKQIVLDAGLFGKVNDNLNKGTLLLLKNGANPNARDAQGLTPIIQAAIKNLHGISWTLLFYGANINARDPQGLTAYDHAIAHGNKDMAGSLAYEMKKKASMPPGGTDLSKNFPDTGAGAPGGPGGPKMLE